MNPQQQYGMPPNQMHPQDQQQTGNFMSQQQYGLPGPMSQNPLSQNPLSQNPLSQNPLSQNPLSQNPLSQNPLNPNYQQHYMNTPQGPDSQQHLAQPSPQVYTQPSPYNQQHSVGSFNVPPGSVSSLQQPQTPQQAQLSIPQQRSTDGRFTSPQSMMQRSPATNVLSNQPIPQHQSVSQSTPGAPPSTRQPSQNAPQPFPTDPLQANKLLILKELRRALHEVSQNATFLLSLKFASEHRGPLSVSNYQALSVGNPPSVNPTTKEPRDPPSEEEIQSARRNYLKSVQQFLAVSDNIEKNYATIIQANKEYQKYDSLSVVKVPSDVALHPYVEMIQPSLETIGEDWALVESTINEMNDLAKKVKAADRQAMDMK